MAAGGSWWQRNGRLMKNSMESGAKIWERDELVIFHVGGHFCYRSSFWQATHLRCGFRSPHHFGRFGMGMSTFLQGAEVKVLRIPLQTTPPLGLKEEDPD